MAADSEQEQSAFEEKFFLVFLKIGRVQIGKEFYWKKVFLEGQQIPNKNKVFSKKSFS